MWRDAFKRRRAIFPVNGFYEWKRASTAKLQYSIAHRDGGMMALASIWDHWDDPHDGVPLSFAVITCPPNELVADIHDRMPVVLDPTDYEGWLHGNADDAFGILKPCPADDLVAYRVSERVGNVRNDGPEPLHNR